MLMQIITFDISSDMFDSDIGRGRGRGGEEEERGKPKKKN